MSIRPCVMHLVAMMSMMLSAPAAWAAAANQADTAQIDVIEIKGEATKLPPDFTVRARVLKVEPAGKVALNWRYGGEAMGGNVFQGSLGGDLEIGQWTPAVPVVSLAGGKFPPAFQNRVWFITFTIGGQPDVTKLPEADVKGKTAAASKPAATKTIAASKPTATPRPVSTAARPRTRTSQPTSRTAGPRGKKGADGPTYKGIEVEFEFSYKGQVLKSFKEAAPDGATLGVAIPHYRLAGGKTPDDKTFVAELSGLLGYAQRRADYIEALPWHAWPLPTKYMVVSDVSGYGMSGYGVRYSNKAVTEAEVRTLRQMGINALRSAPQWLIEMGEKHEGFAKDLGHGLVGGSMGMPVGSAKKGTEDPSSLIGCPFGPDVPEATAKAVKNSLENNLAIPIDQVWALTVDEIGTVFDHTAAGKAHMNTCPRCIVAFQKYVKELGASPEDFGQKNWGDVKPGYGVKDAPGATLYYSGKFNNYATAQLFAALKKAFDDANKAKREALAKGDKSSRAATQPWIYSYALRGNNFLLGGHSLEFFDFYRQADNAFVYEMSNTGPQIWQWDGYLCDVGRIVSTTMDKQFGVYIKPHRGAPVQRALAAVSRGVSMFYWYTYGPEYYKGDSFADNIDSVALASKAGHVIGKCEDVLFGSTAVQPAEVAIVKPRCSELLGNNAQWENAKWVYTALAHAHISIDAIDDVMLAESDLSKYKAIYMNGSHLPRASAAKLAEFVRNGGTLWTSGWGCARDEANQPLGPLAEALGLVDRAAAPELWYAIDRYAAGPVQSFGDGKSVLAEVPAGAKIVLADKTSFMPVVGREVLKPAKDTTVLAHYADGGAAMTVHPYGKGKVYVVGYYAGLEYSAGVRGDRFDMSTGFDAAKRACIVQPALDVTKPAVQTSVPTVEAKLLKNPSNAKKAVTLANWAYKVAAVQRRSDGRTSPVIGVAPVNDLKVSIRLAGDVKKVTSAMLDTELPITRQGDAIEVTLPSIQEGDVLVLE